MSSLPSTRLVIRSPDLIAAGIDDDLVMMSVEQGQYYGITGVGSHVWELLADPISIERIIQSICHEYDIDEATCSADLIAFIEELMRMGLVLAA